MSLVLVSVKQRINIILGAVSWLQQQMNACVWDNRLILAMGSIFETASMLRVNESACISLDELTC